MSFFTAISDFFTSDDGIMAGLTALESVASHVETSNANEKATRIANEGLQAQADALREGNRQAQSRYDDILQQTAPAQTYLRNVLTADPTMLTPAQQTELGDIRRDTQAGLASSGLRGAGRAQVAAFQAVDDRARGRMVDTNRARSDDAARLLSGQYSDAVGASAGLDVAGGQASGTNLALAGDNAADLETTTASNRGKMLGDVTSLITSEFKEQGRESRYADRIKSRTRDIDPQETV